MPSVIRLNDESCWTAEHKFGSESSAGFLTFELLGYGSFVHSHGLDIWHDDEFNMIPML